MTAKRLIAAPAQAFEINDERKRAQIPVRTSATLRERLKAVAAANDRSLTEEIERRLDASFTLEDALGGPRMDEFLRCVAVGIRLVEEKTGKRWTDDTETWRAAQVVVERHFNNWRPLPENHEGIAEKAEAVDAAKAKYEELVSAYRKSFGNNIPLDATKMHSSNALAPHWDSPPIDVGEVKISEMRAALAEMQAAHDEINEAKAALEQAFAEYDAANKRGRDLGAAMAVTMDLISARKG